MKDWDWSLILIIAVIALAALGGAKHAPLVSSTTSSSSGSTIPTPAEHQMTADEIAAQLQTVQYNANQLQAQQQADLIKKNSSVYKDHVFMYINPATDPKYEYVDIYTDSTLTTPVDITGWRLTSTSTGESLVIPQSTLLYFSNSQNTEQDVFLGPNEHAYIITGRSPIGYGMKVNKCSGYLNQYNVNFNPGIYTTCPSPQSEDKSSIPQRIENDNCFDLISSLSSCRIPDPLPRTYSYECQKFLTDKINYPYCVNNHKGDKDFWGTTWYVYLKRSDAVWRYRRDTTILYDKVGKPVAQVVRY